MNVYRSRAPAARKGVQLLFAEKLGDGFWVEDRRRGTEPSVP